VEVNLKRNEITSDETMIRVTLILTIFLFLFSGNIRPDEKNLMFFKSSFRPGTMANMNKVLINFTDSIPDNTLTLYFFPADYPVAFSRNIHTAVCMDTLCRLVDITLFWDVTGKYLGYSLPTGDDLTKKKHTPFSENDYARLNEILADSSSQLGYYSPNELYPVKQTVLQADGITGATIPDLSSWIVPDALYTSYTLWHITYGVTRDSIVAYTKNHLLSNQLLFNLLNGDDQFSQIKGLQWISQTNQQPDQFIESAMKILHGGNFYSSGDALRFLKKCKLDKGRLQKEVVYLFDSKDFRTKNMAIDYFRESEKLNQPVARELMARLKGDNYYMVNVILSLLEKRFEPDHDDQHNLSLLLESKNVNISNRVYYFLLNLPNKSADIAKQLNRYRRKTL
jgi:hypothetical protein